MTTNSGIEREDECPAQPLMRLLAGKFKPELFRLTQNGPLRFSKLLRQLEGANKQSVATALRELHEAGLLEKNVITNKPLHVEYVLSEKGRSLTAVFAQLEQISIGLGGKSGSPEDS